MKTIYEHSSGRGLNTEGWELLFEKGKYFYRSYAGAAVSGEEREERGTVWKVPHDSGVDEISMDDAIELTMYTNLSQVKNYFPIRVWKEIVKIQAGNEYNNVSEESKNRYLQFCNDCEKLHGGDKIYAMED